MDEDILLQASGWIQMGCTIGLYRVVLDKKISKFSFH